jgi:hypothetical protein
MKNEVQLIVRTAESPIGNTSLFYSAGASVFPTFDVFIVGNVTNYIGFNVTITGPLSGLIGTFKLLSAEWDGSLLSNNCIFEGWTPTLGESLNFEIFGTPPLESYLDIYENESISQNWNFTDISEFKVVGSYSRQFRIPLTQRNQEVLGAVSEVNYLSNENADTLFNTKVPAEIRVNSLPIIKGHLRIIRAYKQLDKLTDVEVSFYSETPDLFRAIGDKKLRDITALTELDHVCDYATVLDDTQPYRYTFLDRGQKWDNTGTLNTRPVLNSSNPVFPADLTPSVKWSWLFEKIMNDAGFTFDADDLLATLETYYMPFITRPTLNDPSAFLFAAQLQTLQSFSSGDFLTGTTEWQDNSNLYASDTFTAPVTSVYYFNIWTSVFVASPISNGRIIEIYVTDITTGVDYLAGTISNGNTGAQFIEGFTPTFLTCIETHEYRIKYKVYNLAMLEIPVPQVFNGYSQQYTGCGWQLVQVGDVTTNVPVFMSPLAPDIKQIDFVRDVIAMHNCAIIPDRTQPNRFIMQSMNDYLGSGNKIDWTNKLDISKDIIVESTTDYQKQNIVFTYSLGGDVASKFFNDVGQRTYGDYKINGYTIDATTPSNQFATGDNTVKLTTQSTPAQEVEGTSIVIPKFINDKGEFVNPAMRCLFIGGTADIQLTDGITSTLTSVPVLSHYSVINADYTDNDLNFAPETPLHAIISSPFNNLFNLYWRNYLNGIYSPQSRLMTAHFALDLVDILTFSFADLIWIKDSWWRILEINDYKVGGAETTSVQLLKVVETTAPCEIIPVGSLVNGQVIWQDGNGNPVDGTEICCNEYNWFWSEAKNACYSNIIRRTNLTQAQQSRTLNEIQAPVNSLKSAVGLDADLSSQYSAFVGSSIQISANNLGTLAVGRNLKLDADKRGAVLLGKNVLAKTGGIHLGGGWINDTATNADGGQQFGVVMFSAKDNIAASMDTLPLFIEGINNEHIELANDTLQACTLTLNIIYGTFTGYAIILFQLQKDSAGVCTASAPVLIYQESTGTASPSLIIDTTTNPNQHRLLFQAYGTGFPYSYIVVGSLQYTQLR